MSIEHKKKTMVRISLSTVMSFPVSNAPLAVEIDFRPEWAIEKNAFNFRITILDKKCLLNTNWKPWCLYQTVTLLRGLYAPSGRNRKPAYWTLKKRVRLLNVTRYVTVDMKHVLNTNWNRGREVEWWRHIQSVTSSSTEVTCRLWMAG